MNLAVAVRNNSRCKSESQFKQRDREGGVNKQAFGEKTTIKMHFKLGCWLGAGYLDFFKLTAVHSRGSLGGCIWEDKKLLSCVFLSFSC